MVSSNLGAKLDSIGYARVEKHELVEKRPFYQLGDSKKSAYLDKLEFGELIQTHDLSRRSFSEDGSARNSEPDRAA